MSFFFLYLKIIIVIHSETIQLNSYLRGRKLRVYKPVVFVNLLGRKLAALQKFLN